MNQLIHINEHTLAGFVGGFVAGFISVLLIFVVLNEEGWFDNPTLYKKRM